MIKRFLVAMTAIGVAFLGMTVPAQAGNEWGVPTSTQTVQLERTDKLGARPASSTICVANGIGGTTENTLERWVDTSYGALRLTVLNRCTGYSITNRMTVTTYNAPTESACGRFTNLGSYWDAVQGKYIYNQNPIVWLNTRSGCVPSAVAYSHRLSMYVGYILGLNYTSCTCVMNPATVTTIEYPNNVDRQMMAGVYGLTA